jgi:hypothetical protein
MNFVSPAVDHVAKKIARLPGVEGSYIGRDGAIDAVLETAFDRPLRQHVIQMGMRAMVPVRVFYRMPDGNIVGEGKVEGIEDFYTNIHVAGFAGSDPSAPPDAIAGDAYGDKDVGREKDTRDDGGQLKLTRIRSGSRGRPVVGWRYGKDAVRAGDKVKFKEPCVLQWTMGRTVKVGAGMSGKISQVSSKSPMAYLSMGGHDGIELPVHAIGHVFDVMIDPALESKQMSKPTTVNRALAGLPPQISKLVMTVGFGQPPEVDQATPSDSLKFKGSRVANLQGYSGSKPTEASESEDDEDMLVPKSAKKGDEPKVDVSGKQKTVLLGRK